MRQPSANAAPIADCHSEQPDRQECKQNPDAGVETLGQPQSDTRKHEAQAALTCPAPPKRQSKRRGKKAIPHVVEPESAEMDVKMEGGQVQGGCHGNPPAERLPGKLVEHPHSQGTGKSRGQSQCLNGSAEKPDRQGLDEEIQGGK